MHTTHARTFTTKESPPPLSPFPALARREERVGAALDGDARAGRGARDVARLRGKGEGGECGGDGAQRGP